MFLGFNTVTVVELDYTLQVEELRCILIVDGVQEAASLVGCSSLCQTLNFAEF
jgi:hypothetical protein